MATRILALVGGISRGSLNQKLFRAAQALAPAELEMQSFDISQLPFFSQDLESDLPAPVRELKKQIAEAQGILFVTPEYNHSFPGVLKNAIDWGSRPPGQNSWKGKPAAIIGASAGNIGTFGAQQHLRHVLYTLDVMTMNQPEFYMNGSKAFDANGQWVDEKTKQFLQKHLMAFAEWIHTAPKKG